MDRLARPALAAADPRLAELVEEHAVPLALEVGKDADVVYASVSPYSTARAAAKIARGLGKPLVFDLEDPWALDEMLVCETGLHSVLERRAMGRLGWADAIVMNTSEAVAKVEATFPRLRRKRIVSIVNGYDANDFQGPEPARNDGPLRIVHTACTPSSASVEGVCGAPSAGPSPASTSCRARSSTCSRRSPSCWPSGRSLDGRIELHVAGRLTDGDRAVLAGCPGVHEHGFLPHGETLELMRTADLLFLPMHDMPPGRRVTIVPCKTYEYRLSAGRSSLRCPRATRVTSWPSPASHRSVSRPTCPR